MLEVWLHSKDVNTKVFINREVGEAWVEENTPGTTLFKSVVQNAGTLMSPVQRKVVRTAEASKYVVQRAGKQDCVIASLATVTGSSYERIAQVLEVNLKNGFTPDVSEGLDVFDALGVLFRFGWSGCPIISSEAMGATVTTPRHLSSEEIKTLIKGRPALIGYHDVDAGHHCVVWDGEKAIDCSDGMIIDLTGVMIHHAVVLTKIASCP